jgi:hypothetical protein
MDPASDGFALYQSACPLPPAIHSPGINWLFNEP